jgi:hypothetical protein
MPFRYGCFFCYSGFVWVILETEMNHEEHSVSFARNPHKNLTWIDRMDRIKICEASIYPVYPEYPCCILWRRRRVVTR